MKIKTTLKYHLMPVRMVIIKKSGDRYGFALIKKLAPASEHLLISSYMLRAIYLCVMMYSKFSELSL